MKNPVSDAKNVVGLGLGLEDEDDDWEAAVEVDPLLEFRCLGPIGDSGVTDSFLVTPVFTERFPSIFMC